ncbi:MAG: type II toxin-antitoxin system VapB family antitoxin [Candidatus Andeanibacterium colombiense]|uniref:Type II toxin-antitoxin system VapB family antitoxin n=1 Tax=Candidatus Andeanibacterium colombiense TaxID=3121345 RepID=A0AAJ6BMM6_9SPHN|nr:MAG: type II toxin-antitoxin system VapB family antitoxin [Sphingomonadaceae bacterium]
MNAPSHLPQRKVASVFKSNRSQAVRIPKELAFPEGVKEVYVIRKGKKLEIVPVDALWDDFFDQGPCPDFPERLPQGEYEERESF